MGVTGGAAAFKAVSLASMLRREGHDVDGILSSGALRFITPVQLSCITGRPVFHRLFAEEPGDVIPHITLTNHADLLVVAPATAHFMARMACGLADELITAAALACAAPVVLAPSMNNRMWMNPATVHNCGILRSRGVVFAGPVEGPLACGTVGEGRMMEPEDIFGVCMEILGLGSI
jgi:phosphopantothenoylcysteine decarboxylase/phosphopantothenate--cysteine ligase